MSKKKVDNEIASNRVAFHNYEVLDTYEAGIKLVGTEVKSLRGGGGNLRDNYVAVKNNEAFLCQASIALYKFGNVFNHEERRDRKLLLHKSEIEKLKKVQLTKGYTIIALGMYLKKGMVKVKIGVCRGKKAHDKREALKKKAQESEVKKVLRDH